jgi:sugar phosphate isomerase/epimerase
MHAITRRDLLRGAMTAAAAGSMGLPAIAPHRARAEDDGKGLRFGLVTYLWGKDMPLPELLRVCEQSGVLGVELRTQHAHGVEPSLSKAQRREVRKRFADSPVTLVGYGSNAQFHENDPAKVRHNIELTKQYVQLMQDCGASGVKVKPNGFVPDVPRQRTIEQIGRALNVVAAFGAEHNQQIRVEAHGRGTSELPVMKAIFDVADHPNVGVCWNSNDVDVQGKGLAANFHLVRKRFGDTVHVRELNEGDYPYQQLFDLMVGTDYAGWILLEARTNPNDKVRALREQREVFEAMVSKAKQRT